MRPKQINPDFYKTVNSFAFLISERNPNPNWLAPNVWLRQDSLPIFESIVFMHIYGDIPHSDTSTTLLPFNHHPLFNPCFQGSSFVKSNFQSGCLRPRLSQRQNRQEILRIATTTDSKPTAFIKDLIRRLFGQAPTAPGRVPHERENFGYRTSSAARSWVHHS